MIGRARGEKAWTPRLAAAVTIVVSLAAVGVLAPGAFISGVGLVLLFLTNRHEPIGARWRLFVAAAAGGVAAGVTAAAGSRVAMRIVALAVPGPTAIVQGEVRPVPLFTLEGTLEIIGFVGLVGTALGPSAMTIRRLVPLSGMRRGIALGSIMLAFPGILIFATDPEFEQVPPVSISAFALCFLAYGLVFEAAASGVERWRYLVLPMPKQNTAWKHSEERRQRPAASQVVIAVALALLAIAATLTLMRGTG